MVTKRHWFRAWLKSGSPRLHASHSISSVALSASMVLSSAEGKQGRESISLVTAQSAFAPSKISAASRTKASAAGSAAKPDRLHVFSDCSRSHLRGSGREVKKWYSASATFASVFSGSFFANAAARASSFAKV